MSLLLLLPLPLPRLGLPLVLGLVGCRPAPEAGPHAAASISREGSGVEPWSAEGAGEQPSLPIIEEAADIDDAEGVVHFLLRAAAATHTLTDWQTGEVRTVEGYAYNGLSPGPTLRARVGDTVLVELVNELDVETTLHWHGLQVPWSEDGVTWMAEPVAPGTSRGYRFVVDRPGTFWYHPHFDPAHQVDLGLYGAFIVEDPAEPAADRDLVLVFDDWPEAEGEVGGEGEGEGGGGEGSDDTGDDPTDAYVHGAHGAEGLWTVNGAVRPRLDLDAAEGARLRILNVSNAGYLALHWADQRWIGGDQGLLPAAEAPDQVVLGAGDRGEFEIVAGGSGFRMEDRPWSLAGGAGYGEAEARLDVVVTGTSSPGAPLPLPYSGEAPTPDPGRTDLLYTFQGELHSDTWMINGEQYPDVTVQSAPYGAEQVIEVRNLSASTHPFHLHGMSFEVLSVDGVAPTHRTVEDTVDLGLYQTLRLRLVADNPGDWMLHCHILPHEHGGMMTVLRVE
jgi:FtsP/CotA-like multicopper oxidase with cupredoxin domain